MTLEGTAEVIEEIAKETEFILSGEVEPFFKSERPAECGEQDNTTLYAAIGVLVIIIIILLIKR